MDFTHKLFYGPKEQIPAMNRVKAIIKDGNFSGLVFPFSKGYAAWETDEVPFFCAKFFPIKKVIFFSFLGDL